MRLTATHETSNISVPMIHRSLHESIDKMKFDRLYYTMRAFLSNIRNRP